MKYTLEVLQLLQVMLQSFGKVTLMSMIGEDKKFYTLLKKKLPKKYRFKTYI